jgi:predicted dinucleotide-binding enzyme
MTSYGFLGTGQIGTTLGGRAAGAGLDVVFGSRTPRPGTDLGGPVLSYAGAIGRADVVVIAIPGNSVDEFLGEHGAALSGKLVIDATNRVGAEVWHSDAQIAALGDVRYARAFASLGVEVFAEPDFEGVRADLFFAADPEDRATVATLIEAVGLRPIAVGDARKAHIVDAAAAVWFALVFGEKQPRRIAFRTLGL